MSQELPPRKNLRTLSDDVDFQAAQGDAREARLHRVEQELSDARAKIAQLEAEAANLKQGIADGIVLAVSTWADKNLRRVGWFAVSTIGILLIKLAATLAAPMLAKYITAWASHQ